MRRRALLLASAASAAAILGGWQLGAVGIAPAPIAQGGGRSVGSSGSVDAAASGSGRATGGSGSTGAADGDYAGTTVSTRFGDVQVRVTVSDGAIVDVAALQLTDHDRRSIAISNRAAPILRDEVLQAQSASVAMVSGATYTSAAYLESLQAALDEAGL